MNKNSASESPPGPAAGPHPGLGQQTHKDGTPPYFPGVTLATQLSGHSGLGPGNGQCVVDLCTVSLSLSLLLGELFFFTFSPALLRSNQITKTAQN